MDHDEQMIVTRHIMSLLDSWGIDKSDQVRVLGLPDDTRSRSLRRYHDDTPFPADEQTMKRVAHLLGIGQALNTMFPRSGQMGARWLNRTNRHFPKQSPIHRMINDGLPGMQAVHAHLDCTYFWDLTGSKA